MTVRPADQVVSRASARSDLLRVSATGWVCTAGHGRPGWYTARRTWARGSPSMMRQRGSTCSSAACTRSFPAACCREQDRGPKQVPAALGREPVERGVARMSCPRHRNGTSNPEARHAPRDTGSRASPRRGDLGEPGGDRHRQQGQVGPGGREPPDVVGRAHEYRRRPRHPHRQAVVTALLISQHGVGADREGANAHDGGWRGVEAKTAWREWEWAKPAQVLHDRDASRQQRGVHRA